MMPEFCSIFIRNTVKQGRSLNMVSVDNVSNQQLNVVASR